VNIAGLLDLPRPAGWSWTAAGLLAVALLFCAPLFVGLGRWDLRSDEAIYAYSIDRILETGEWLTPRSIEVDGPFLEKPPLKFWMVAALMRAGLLPRGELGLRWLDAALSSLAFVYVYLFGARLWGPIAGIVAVLLLFASEALIFEHGVRSNNMEAALLLCYTGGLDHFARWLSTSRRGAIHVVAVCAYFVLGFMTKFVAALFLPVIAMTAAVASRRGRMRVTSEWRAWIVPILVSLVVISTWFVYESVVFGRRFWDVILGLHIVTRFAGVLDPAHLQPWSYYFEQTWIDAAGSGSLVIGCAGVALLVWAALSARPPEARLLFAWWLVPFVLISAGTSKLFHYAYPFLPPLALAGGWAAAIVLRLPAAWEREAGPRTWFDLTPRGARLDARLQMVGTAIAIALVVLAIVTAVWGPVAWRPFGVRLFQNSSIVRPALLAVLIFAAVGRAALAARLLAVVVVALMLPIRGYREQLARTATWDNPLHVLSECATETQRTAGAGRGVYNAALGRLHHAYYYYLHGLGPWTEAEHPDRGELARRFFQAGAETPVVVTLDDYGELTRAASPQQPPLTQAVEIDGVVILLPGPYEACAAPVLAATPRGIDRRQLPAP
jgi:4-amino-4-deoxy-L-arabinose transferase-like glycosyltransferase